MSSRLWTITKRLALLLAVVAVTLLSVRVYDTQRGPPLEPWHTIVPEEMSAAELDQADWQDYLKTENTIFEQVRADVTRQLEPEDRAPINRYFEGSAVYPGHFPQDWNRSFALEPEGPPRGAAVFLHGLTDAPYSMRHLARLYRDLGWVSVTIRLPGHGTVPGGLTGVDWQQWLAAARLAVREARRRAGPTVPLHIVGYSNGGALALMYALQAIDNQQLSRPDRLVLLSPMVGVTAFARFAGLAGLPAIFPAFAKAAWISIVPEYNPFKYNSFPVKSARQSFLLTDELQRELLRHARSGSLSELPPVITFQSAIDFTVSTRAIVTALYDPLPANGSELVLFDLNRHTTLQPLLRAAADDLPARLLPDAPRRFRATVISNDVSDSGEVVERVVEAGAVGEVTRPLGIAYPPDVYSLSHVALPFPTSDGLYGLEPDPAEDFGIRLGALAARGERGALVVSLDFLLRLSSNPFFPYVLQRIEACAAVDAPR